MRWGTIRNVGLWQYNYPERDTPGEAGSAQVEHAESLPDVRISLVPKSVVVVTSLSPRGLGATTIAWNGVISSRPPIISVSFLPDSFCRQRIIECREFVINVPGRSMLPQVELLGARSGPLGSKLALSEGAIDHFLVSSTEIRTPGLSGYMLNIECRVLQSLQFGLYDCFFGQALAIKGRSDLIRKNGHPRGEIDFVTDPPITCFGDDYWCAGEILGKTRENKNHPHGQRH